jgi:FkbM family methyltransferase
LREFVPPIVGRTISYFRRSLGREARERISPFNAVPKDLKVCWVMDIGANRGDVAIAALKSYPEAKVMCFEPVGSTYEALGKALSAFSDRAYLFNFALSDHAGQGEIHLTTFHGANSLAPQTESHKALNPHVREVGSETIRLTRLDDIVGDLPSTTIDVMKIDVEGHELSVLRGGRTFIEKNVDTIIIEISMMRDASSVEQAIFPIFALLNDMGFRLINVFDLYPGDQNNLMLAQMDCVFRHSRHLTR